MSRGFVLLEVTISYVILALAIVALVPAFILAIKANKSTEQIQVATDLSQEMLEEVRMRKWDESTPLPPAYVTTPSATLGPDAGENAASKATFDDVDDFNGWQENGIRNPLGAALSGFGGYRRSVTVQYVDSSLAPSGTPTDFKQVTACTTTPKGRSVCLDTVYANR